MQKGAIKDLVSGLAGGGAFVALHSIAHLGLIPSIGLSVLALLSFYLMFASSTVKETTFALIEGITNDVYKKTIAESNESLQEIRSFTLKIKSQSVRTKAEDICTTVEDILDKVQKDPKKIKLIRRFFSNHLESTATILKKYLEIANQRVKTVEMEQLLEKVEMMLDTIKDSFERQLARAMENDVMDLDVEIKTLENLLKSEGL